MINTQCNNLYQIGKSLIKFSTEKPEDTTKQENQLLNCLCCKKTEDPFEVEARKRIEELVTNAPVKDELATHDGIIYFPRELMPADKQEDI